jgi:hypothetical protein
MVGSMLEQATMLSSKSKVAEVMIQQKSSATGELL